MTKVNRIDGGGQISQLLHKETEAWLDGKVEDLTNWEFAGGATFFKHNGAPEKKLAGE